MQTLDGASSYDQEPLELVPAAIVSSLRRGNSVLADTQDPTSKILLASFAAFLAILAVKSSRTQPLSYMSSVKDPFLRPPVPLTPDPVTSNIYPQVCSSEQTLEFHAEWLRDEPCDATATGLGSYIPVAWCQLSPGNGEHEIRVRGYYSAFPYLFSFSGKEVFVF